MFYKDCIPGFIRESCKVIYGFMALSLGARGLAVRRSCSSSGGVSSRPCEVS